MQLIDQMHESLTPRHKASVESLEAAQETVAAAHSQEPGKILTATFGKAMRPVAEERKHVAQLRRLIFQLGNHVE